MAKIERKLLAHYIDAAEPSAVSPLFVRLGADLEELTIELSAQVDKKKNIIGETSTNISGYEPSAAVEPYYAEPGTPLHTRLSRIVNKRLVLDDLRTTMVDVELWTAEVGDEYDAWQEEAFIEVVSYGGDTTGVQIPFNLHLTGKRAKGVFDINERTFTPQDADGGDGGDGGGNDGKDGVTYIPAVSADGWISWTRSDGGPVPDPVYIGGPAGPAGPNQISPATDVSDIPDGKYLGVSGGKVVGLPGGDTPVIDIHFPDALYLAKGKPFEIYHETLAPALPGDHTMLISGTAVGSAYERKFSCKTNVPEGDRAITLRVYDKLRREVYTKQCTVHTYLNPTSPGTQKVMFIGDSLTVLGTAAMAQMESYCTEDFGSNLFQFVGTQGADAYKHEAFGGASLYSFTTASANNPFWDSEAGALSFSGYSGRTGITPNIAVIHLGVNDLVSSERSAETTLSYLNTFIDALRSDWPDTLVYIVTPGQVASQDALANNFGANFKALSVFDQAMYDYAAMICETYTGVSKISVVPNYYGFDRAFNYTKTSVPANPFVTDTVESGDDALHPKAAAYAQIGANIYHTWMYSPHTGGESVTLTNLISNHAFENGTTGWEVNGAASDTTFAANGDGTASIEILTTASKNYFYTQQRIAKHVAGHKYYVRVENQMQVVFNGSASDAPFSQCITMFAYSDGTSMNIVSRGAPSSLAISSGIVTATNDTATVYNRIMFMVGTAGDLSGTVMRYGRVLCIDLTEAFGDGNEPTKEWCDANIPDFEGAITI